MWIEKLARGVLELDTPLGPRYLRPNLVQRALLLWTFRNFFSLPQQVLRRSERQLIDRLVSENRFVSVPAIGASEWPVIGRIERRPPAPVEVLPMRKPVSASQSQSAIAEPGEETASA